MSVCANFSHIQECQVSIKLLAQIYMQSREREGICIAGMSTHSTGGSSGGREHKKLMKDFGHVVKMKLGLSDKCARSHEFVWHQRFV